MVYSFKQRSLISKHTKLVDDYKTVLRRIKRQDTRLDFLFMSFHLFRHHMIHHFVSGYVHKSSLVTMVFTRHWCYWKLILICQWSFLAKMRESSLSIKRIGRGKEILASTFRTSTILSLFYVIDGMFGGFFGSELSQTFSFVFVVWGVKWAFSSGDSSTNWRLGFESIYRIVYKQLLRVPKRDAMIGNRGTFCFTVMCHFIGSLVRGEGGKTNKLFYDITRILGMVAFHSLGMGKLAALWRLHALFWHYFHLWCLWRYCTWRQNRSKKYD